MISIPVHSLARDTSDFLHEFGPGEIGVILREYDAGQRLVCIHEGQCTFGAHVLEALIRVGRDPIMVHLEYGDD